MKLKNYWNFSLPKLFSRQFWGRTFCKICFYLSGRFIHFCSYKFKFLICLLPMIGQAKKTDLNKTTKEFNDHLGHYRVVFSPSIFIITFMMVSSLDPYKFFPHFTKLTQFGKLHRFAALLNTASLLRYWKFRLTACCGNLQRYGCGILQLWAILGEIVHLRKIEKSKWKFLG